MANYVIEGQMSIFDLSGQEEKFPPVVNELSEALKSFLKVTSEKYEIWDHVKNLGYRYSTSVSIKNSDWEHVMNELEKIEKEYARSNLEVSALQSPCYRERENTRLFISTLWKDKIRAKNG